MAPPPVPTPTCPAPGPCLLPLPALQACDRVWAAIQSGEGERDPSLLQRLLLLTYCDLKQYKYRYCSAFQPCSRHSPSPPARPLACSKPWGSKPLLLWLLPAVVRQPLAACQPGLSAWAAVARQRSPRSQNGTACSKRRLAAVGVGSCS